MSESAFAPTAGEKCRVDIFMREDLEGYDPLPDATDALQRLCRPHGFKPQDIHLASMKPWTEPIGGVEPVAGLTVCTYEATACPEMGT
jgi:hypothetical protein